MPGCYVWLFCVMEEEGTASLEKSISLLCSLLGSQIKQGLPKVPPAVPDRTEEVEKEKMH